MKAILQVRYNCSVVGEQVTVAVAEIDRPGLPPAKQMKWCTSAQYCKIFGDPPFEAAFSDPMRSGCPYQASLNTTVKPG